MCVKLRGDNLKLIIVFRPPVQLKSPSGNCLFVLISLSFAHENTLLQFESICITFAALLICMEIGAN